MKRSERPAQIWAISSVRRNAEAESPPNTAATAGAAARAMPPRPMHSMTAESPMSRAASDGCVALAQQRLADLRPPRR